MTTRAIQTRVGDLLPGASLAHTTPPAMPGNFLSRKSCLGLFDTQAPGATIVVAPPGYGKTTLVAEWSHQNKERVFWATATGNEKTADFRNIVFQAVRNVIPDFAPWFKPNTDLDSIEIFKRFFEDIAALGKDYVFVLDNGTLSENLNAVKLAQYMVDIIPDNLHLILIRRTAVELSFVRFAQRGNLNLISATDLKFDQAEIGSIASLNGLDSSDPNIDSTLKLANGWPVCVQLLAKNYSKGMRLTNFSIKMASPMEPLRILTTETFNILSITEQEQLMKLSILKEFDLDTAQIILGKDHSIQYLNRISSDGFLTIDESANPRYEFNTIFRETIQHLAAEKGIDLAPTRKHLMEYFIFRKMINEAVEQAFELNDFIKMHDLLKEYSRQLTATGQGDQMIRLAPYAGDDSPHGLLLRKTVEVMGHVTNLNFMQAEIEAQQLILESANSAIGDFTRKIANAAMMYVNFSKGLITVIDTHKNELFDEEVITGDLETSDKIAILRIAGDKAFIFDYQGSLEMICRRAQGIALEGVDVGVPYSLNILNCMSLFTKGNYLEAFDAARLAIAQAEEKGYVGIAGPIEAYIVLGRCYLEFSKIDEAYTAISRARDLSKEWKQWPWYFVAEGILIRLVVSMGDYPRATEMIRKMRSDFFENHISTDSGWIVDMSEIYLRYTLNDMDRVEILLNRTPDTSFTKLIRDELAIRKGKIPKEIDIDKLPDSTPREKLRKLITMADAVSDRENECSVIMQQALNLGSEIGAYETFMRQSEPLTNVILKIAGKQPTIYLEELSRLITKRIKTKHQSTGSLKENLTSRELEIVKHLSTAKPISTIAKSLHISQNTIKTHLRNVYRKLEVDGRDSAVEKARELFLV
jgi:LuxR family maltose regulon positive regulatory protein